MQVAGVGCERAASTDPIGLRGHRDPPSWERSRLQHGWKEPRLPTYAYGGAALAVMGVILVTVLIERRKRPAVVTAHTARPAAQSPNPYSGSPSRTDGRRATPFRGAKAGAYRTGACLEALDDYTYSTTLYSVRKLELARRPGRSRVVGRDLPRGGPRVSGGRGCDLTVSYGVNARGAAGLCRLGQTKAAKDDLPRAGGLGARGDEGELARCRTARPPPQLARSQRLPRKRRCRAAVRTASVEAYRRTRTRRAVRPRRALFGIAARSSWPYTAATTSAGLDASDRGGHLGPITALFIAAVLCWTVLFLWSPFMDHRSWFGSCDPTRRSTLSTDHTYRRTIHLRYHAQRGVRAAPYASSAVIEGHGSTWITGSFVPAWLQEPRAVPSQMGSTDPGRQVPAPTTETGRELSRPALLSSRACSVHGWRFGRTTRPLIDPSDGVADPNPVLTVIRMTTLGPVPLRVHRLDRRPLVDAVARPLRRQAPCRAAGPRAAGQAACRGTGRGCRGC